MIIVIFCSLLCLLFTYLESNGRLKNGMSFGFFLVTFLGCIHYDYGNDYPSYYSLFQQIEATLFNFKSIMDGDVYRESGWVLLCYAFVPLGGFFTMVAVLNIIQNFIIYRFIRKEVNKEWWSVAVFVYLFHTSYYLMNFSMMRQGFVVCVFLGMWTFIKERKWIVPLIILFLCSFVHGTSKVLIPFAFIGFLPNISGKKLAYFFIGLLIFLWTSISFISDFFNTLFTYEEFEEYARYEEETSGFSVGIGVLIQLLPLFVSLYYLLTNKYVDKTNKLLISIAILSYVITPFTRIVPGVGRIGIYFGIYSFAVIPLTYSYIKDEDIRTMLLALYFLVTGYDYIIFFKNPAFTKSYSEFYTIFSVM